jgi:Uma2 family endonuclease
MAIVSKANTPDKGERPVPDFLIKEFLDGKPIYYKGFRSVLDQTNKPEDIMGCSGLQSVIIFYLLRVCYSQLDLTRYWPLTNEVGAHIDKRKNFASDIAIFDKTILTPDKINKNYPSVPPKVVFEIDLKVALEEANMSEFEYVLSKTRQLHNFGVEKVFWISTSTQKVTVAAPGYEFAFVNWDEDIELFEGIRFNIGQYLKEEGIKVG